MDSILKELLPPLPVMYVKAVVVQPHWIADGVGFLRKVIVGKNAATASTTPSVFQCPPMNPNYSSPFQHPLFVSPDASQCLPSTPNDFNSRSLLPN